MDDLKKMLLKHEALRLKPYRDTVGKLTIGVGRNLDDKGITEEEAYAMLEHDITDVKSWLGNALPWIIDLDEPRRNALYDMAFNMGVSGLLEWHNTLDMIRTGRYKEAADKMLQTKWAGQVGSRAEYLAKIMETGEL